MFVTLIPKLHMSKSAHTLSLAISILLSRCSTLRR